MKSIKIKHLFLTAFFLLPSAIVFSQNLELIPAGESVLHENTRIIKIDRTSCASDIKDVLKQEGFSFKDASNEVTIHGLWNASIRVYVDGILMNDPFDGKFNWDSISLSQIKSIEIDEANAECVIIKISTYSENFLQNQYFIEASSKSYANNVFDKNRISAGLTFPFEIKNAMHLQIEEKFSFCSAENRFGYRSREVSYKPYENTFENYGNYPYFNKGYEEKNLGNSLSLLIFPYNMNGSHFGIVYNFYFDDAECGSVKGGRYPVEKNQKKFLNSINLPGQFYFENFNIESSLSYFNSILKYKEADRFSSLNNNYFSKRIDERLKVTIPELLNLSVEESAAFSIIDQDSVHNKKMIQWSASAGIKKEDFIDWEISTGISVFKNTPDWTAALKLHKKVSDDFDLFFNAGKSVTQPSAEQLYYAGAGGKGNEDLKCEHALLSKLKCIYKDYFYLSPYLTYYKDKIQWRDTGSNNWTCMNIGKSVNYGFDFGFYDLQIGNYFFLSANYTLCNAVLKTKGFKGNQIQHTPKHNLYSAVKFKNGNFSWTTEFNFNDGCYTENTNSQKTAAQYLLDTRVDLNLSKADIFLILKNLLDYSYASVDSLPGAGLSFEGGVRLKF